MAKKAKSSRKDALKKKVGAKPKKAAKRAPSAAGKAKAAAARKKHAGSRQPALLGHEQVRNLKLDRACERIGEARDAINDLKKDEASLQQDALLTMRRDNVTTYTHHGITLIRVTGDDKLRVLKARTEEASASSDINEGGDDDGDVETEAEGAEHLADSVSDPGADDQA